MNLGRLLQRLCIQVVLGSFALSSGAQTSPDKGWPDWGGTLAGNRYSTANQINEQNVSNLKVAWTFHTHALDTPSAAGWRTLFEATPVLWKDKLYLDTPFNVVFAVDAATGAQRWSFDPHVDRKSTPYMIVARGVALWHASKEHAGLCGEDRVFVATVDNRLIAMDANSGKACRAFGDNGQVDLLRGLNVPYAVMYFVGSPPLIIGDTVVVGSGVGDNQAIYEAPGTVRGFDAVTGRLKWSWNPVRWTEGQKHPTSGSGNVWSEPSADPEHDLVFLPTGSASVDFYGALRIGDNRDADSIVALRASTGEKVWAYQFVHHDLWDYDTPSQPVLFTFQGKIPAVAVTTKTNMIFVFNRLTGEPLYPIQERPVPKSTVPGEVAWPTQPFSSLPPLGPQGLRAEDIHLQDKKAEAFCKSVVSQFDNKGLFTPPSLRGAIVNPGNAGGSNWGSSAFDPQTGVLYTRISNMPFLVRLRSKEDLQAAIRRQNPRTFWEVQLRHFTKRAPSWLGGDAPDPQLPLEGPPDKGGRFTDDPMDGTPYQVQRGAIKAPDDHVCGPAPLGAVVATNLQTGQRLWSVPIGKVFDDEPGAPGNSGVIATAGNLLFGGSSEGVPALYAFSSQSGHQLWQGPLPAPAMANPMTYTLHGKQYVVVSAGGSLPKTATGKPFGDAVVAFALPDTQPVDSPLKGHKHR